MSEFLPRLRSTLEVLPSPVPDEPGVVLRDPMRYSEDILLIPAAWVPMLSCLDGNHTGLDVQALMVRRGGGELVYSDQVNEFVSVLKNRGFLETEEFFALQEKRHAEFHDSPKRNPAHAGSAYPEDVKRLRESLDSHFPPEEDPRETSCGSLLGLAAPHVSLEGGWDCYAAAYQRLDPSWSDKTFVILGTSHCGRPDTFGLTRKPFVTPIGSAEVDAESVDFLARRAPGAVSVEDYCHAVEHSIEIQVVFLQYRLNAPVKIVPVLCGPFLEGLEEGSDSSASLGRFLDALSELANRRGDDLCWILGIDLAHIGKRYGDRFAVRSGDEAAAEVASRDRERLARVCEGDFVGLRDLVKPEADPLKWCGFSPLYTFLGSLKPIKNVEGRVLLYQQWGIDPESLVTFAGIEFFVDEEESTSHKP